MTNDLFKSERRAVDMTVLAAAIVGFGLAALISILSPETQTPTPTECQP